MVLLLGALVFAPSMMLQAATSNPSPASPGYFTIPIHFDSQLTSTVADKAEFTMPWPAQLVQVQCVARALGGTDTPTYTFTLQEASGTLATCAPVTAGTVVEGTISDAAVADEANITLDYASAGTSPTADDVTVILFFKRL
jgi:hypothetical protein